MKLSFENSFISATGKVLIKHPGIVFPKHVVQARAGFRPETGKAYTKIPQGGISTREVADLMGCSPSGARQYLRRKKVKFILIRRRDGSLECFWDKRVVLQLLNVRGDVRRVEPRGYYSTQETVSILGMARSSLYRMSRKGLLEEKKIRVRTSRGVRVKCFYSKTSVMQIFARRNESRRH